MLYICPRVADAVAVVPPAGAAVNVAVPAAVQFQPCPYSKPVTAVPLELRVAAYWFTPIAVTEPLSALVTSSPKATFTIAIDPSFCVDDDDGAIVQVSPARVTVGTAVYPAPEAPLALVLVRLRLIQLPPGRVGSVFGTPDPVCHGGCR